MNDDEGMEVSETAINVTIEIRRNGDHLPTRIKANGYCSSQYDSKLTDYFVSCLNDLTTICLDDSEEKGNEAITSLAMKVSLWRATIKVMKDLGAMFDFETPKDYTPGEVDVPEEFRDFIEGLDQSKPDED